MIKEFEFLKKKAGYVYEDSYIDKYGMFDELVSDFDIDEWSWMNSNFIVKVICVPTSGIIFSLLYNFLYNFHAWVF